MQVLILAAGYATRLYPLTLNQPKPLLPVAGKPMLEHIIDHLATVKDIIPEHESARVAQLVRAVRVGAYWGEGLHAKALREANDAASGSMASRHAARRRSASTSASPG